MTAGNPELYKMIFSAFLGGGIASVFNYYSRKTLATWKNKKEEEKLAYICFIKLSYLAALISLIKCYVNTQMQQVNASKHDAKVKDVDTEHQVCIRIAAEMNKLIKTQEFEKQLEQLHSVEGIFKDFIEIKINEEVLLKMSQTSILHYQLLTQSLDSIKYSLVYWMGIVKDKKNIEAFLVFQTWLALKKIDEHSEALLIVLLEKANIKKSEGDRILKAQLGDMTELLIAGVSDKEKIETVSKIYHESAAK